MSSAAVGTHSGAGPLSLMSCVRESSPLQDYEPPDPEKNAATKKKFWNPKKWFKRKNKAAEDVITTVETSEKDVLRSRSTSELSIAEEQTRRRSGSSMHPGLSVSHDSVFHSPNSGSDIELDAAQSSSSLSISQPHIDLRLQTELSERLRLRRGRGDTSEDDEGLPHSPCNSPTTADALLDKTAIKDLPTKSHSTCSDGSLLSMGSSEMDEESFSQQSRHSSKLSLQEKRSSDQDSDLELEPSGSSSAPLNHSAAHHRVSVRPKRRAPHRSKRVPQLSTALPTTPEVNEESSIRSMTPENISRDAAPELYSMKAPLTESQLKCSSLPPGLAAPSSDPAKLNRSRSNAGSQSQDFSTVEEDVEREEKSDKSFFDRIFPRRSGKKRKSKEEKPVAAPRSGAAARQRIQPIDLPIAPDESPPKTGTSPLQIELENRFKQRLATPPQSPVFEKTVIFKKEECRKQMKIPALSSLQQRVLTLNSDEADNSGYKSLTDFSDEVEDEQVKSAKPVIKSHSFKATTIEAENKFIKSSTEKIAKAASFDSIKNLEEPVFLQEAKQESNENEIKDFISSDNITISGPSHTAIVNVSSNTIDTYSTTNTKTETLNSSDKIKEITMKEQVSVTKIQLKRESTQITQSTVTVPKNAVPEFLNRQLNKVETRSSSNVVFSMNSPRIIDEQSRPKTVSEPKVIPRKFSQEDLEIIEKTEEITLIPMAVAPRFKKNDNKRKSSVSSTTPESPKREKPFLRSRSISLDSLKGENEASSDKSSQDSLDKLDEKMEEESPVKEKSGSAVETVVLRKKSLIKQKTDEEPELMKVFARRSLKLKDSDSEQLNTMLENSKTRDSDKENQSDSPVERKKSVGENREPLIETATEIITLKKPNLYTRTFSVNPPPKEEKVRKQASFSDRRKTDNWITNMKNGDDLIERRISQDEIITGISPKSEFISTAELITETKNFNQRKAEWEKRAQEAQKKSVP